MAGHPIVLVGPMGVGKTTIGKKLARRLGREFIDTDQQIVAKHGEISKIFNDQGEEFFRRIEEQELENCLRTDAVVSTGGGAVLSIKNQELLAETDVVYLQTDGKHIMSRLVKGNRPLLQGGFENWQSIYDSRKPIYEKLAKVTVSTSNKGLRAIVDEICGKLGLE